MIPLSTRMRLTSAEEFVGQRHFFYKGSLLYNSIQKKTFDSAIFFGPSGTGKTTLARLIASSLDYEKWSLETLPILPETWQLTVSKDKEKQFSVLKELLFKSDM